MGADTELFKTASEYFCETWSILYWYLSASTDNVAIASDFPPYFDKGRKASAELMQMK